MDADHHRAEPHGLLAVGLVLRSRIAFTLAVALAAYQLLTSALAMIFAGMVGPWPFALIGLPPASLVIVGLAASWRVYWRPYS